MLNNYLRYLTYASMVTGSLAFISASQAMEDTADIALNCVAKHATFNQALPLSLGYKGFERDTNYPLDLQSRKYLERSEKLLFDPSLYSLCPPVPTLNMEYNYTYYRSPKSSAKPVHHETIGLSLKYQF